MKTYFEEINDTLVKAHKGAEPKTFFGVWKKVTKRYLPRGKAYRRMLELNRLKYYR